jgi:DNA-3-methyladenine glycosylase
LTAAQLRAAPVLPREFFNRDPATVARELLGKVLIRREGRNLLAGRVVEDEAYLGQDDPAAHAFGGQTARNSVLFGPPGHAYVYFIYGMYECLNLVAEPEGQSGCVLIRALEPVAGVETMQQRRPAARKLEDLASGPGKLTLALGITRACNGIDVTRGSLVVRAPAETRKIEMATSPRIGITKCVDWPLRFYIRGNRFVSGPR